MRKSMGVFIVLLVALVSVAAVSVAAVNKTGYEVEIGEEVLYGDKSAANGVELTVPVDLSSKVFWETTYTVGEQDVPQTGVWLVPMGHHEYEGSEGHQFSLIM